MGLLEEGLSLLYETLDVEASIDIIYRREGVSIEMIAIPTKPFFVSATGSAPPDPAKSERNFSIMASDLILDDVPFQPVTTDEIIETIDGVGYVYRVANPSSGASCWEYETGYMLGHPLARIMIHTKYTGGTECAV